MVNLLALRFHYIYILSVNVILDDPIVNHAD